MAANKKIQKLVMPTTNIGDCDGGVDCGDGWCCPVADYVCCPDNDHYTNWCAATLDDCPTYIKKLPKMAANKKIQKLVMSTTNIGDCDGGVDCGDGWCCPVADYVCCPDNDHSQIGVQLLLMTALLLSRSCQRWLPTKRF